LALLPSPKSIKTKLFLTMLMASSGVAICMFLVMQWSFDRGFLNYVNTQDREQSAALSLALATEYESAGDWEQLAKNPRKWHELISGSSPDLFLSPRQKREPGHPPIDHNRRPRDDSTERRTPPHLSPKQRPNQKSDSRQSTTNFQRPEPPVRRPPPNQQRPRVALFDVEKNTIFGPPEGASPFSLSPITLDEQVIGYLGIKPIKELSDAHDLVFVQEQSQTFLVIALAMMMVSMLISIPIAGHLVKPIKHLAKGTRRLTSGKFDTQIPVITRDELGTLSADFNTLANTLKENENARQQWVADISHELRTPLAILKGEIEALEDGIRPLTQGNISSLGQEVDHLTHLVGDLYELSMSDIGALNYQKSPTDVLPILEHCVDTFTDQFSSKNINLSFDSMNLNKAMLFVDPQRIKQLINNLLKNSYRYTDKGGNSLLTIEKQHSEMLIHLQDSSPGVAKEEIPRLFERLYRVDSSRNRASGGAGLGLAICSNIVTAHSGSISAQPSAQGGLWVTVRFPITRL